MQKLFQFNLVTVKHGYSKILETSEYTSPYPQLVLSCNEFIFNSIANSQYSCFLSQYYNLCLLRQEIKLHSSET